MFSLFKNNSSHSFYFVNVCFYEVIYRSIKGSRGGYSLLEGKANSHCLPTLVGIEIHQLDKVFIVSSMNRIKV